MYRGGSTEWSRCPGALPPMPMTASMVVGFNSPTEYKVVAQSLGASGRLRSDTALSRDSTVARGTGMLRVKARAGARQLRGDGLDPSAFPVPYGSHSVGAKHRLSVKKHGLGTVVLDSKGPIQSTSHAPRRQTKQGLRHRRAGPSYTLPGQATPAPNLGANRVGQVSMGGANQTGSDFNRR